jgi:4-amino-4-deoxy-L-arabinose transferase-like glycosyltransferase
MRRTDAARGQVPSTVPAGAPRIGFALVLAAAAALRGIALDKPLYIDEIVTVTVAAHPLSSMAGVMHHIDASPALFPLLLHGWLTVSHADAWVRALPALLGLLAVGVVGAIATRAFGWRTGLAAAAIMAVAPGHIHYSQYVRGYSLFTLLAASHVWLFLRWFDSPSRITSRGWLLVVLASTALCYTHYLAVLLFAAEGVVAIALWPAARTRWLTWGSAIVVAGFLFLPGASLFAENMRADRLRNPDRAERPPVAQLVPNLVAELSVGQQMLGFDDPTARRLTLGAAAIVFPSLWLAGLMSGLRDRPRTVLALTLLAWLPVVAYVVSGRRLVAVRFFLPFMAGYIAVLAHGWIALRPRWRAVAGAALMVVCAVPLWRYYSEFTWSYDHRRVAAALEERILPGDVLLFVHPYEAFFYRWYLGDRVPMEGLVFTALTDQPGYVIKPADLDFERARARVEQAAARFSRVWVVGQSRRSFASNTVEQARLLAWMDTKWQRLGDLAAVTGGDPDIRLYGTAGRRPEGP